MFEILKQRDRHHTIAVRQVGGILNKNLRTIMNGAYSCIFDNLGDLGCENIGNIELIMH